MTDRILMPETGKSTQGGPADASPASSAAPFHHETAAMTVADNAWQHVSQPAGPIQPGALKRLWQYFRPPSGISLPRYRVRYKDGQLYSWRVEERLDLPLGFVWWSDVSGHHSSDDCVKFIRVRAGERLRASQVLEYDETGALIRENK